MASKGTIGTKIVIEGEREYRAALKSINQEQRELRSEMNLCVNEFAGQQNSLEALTKKHEVLQKQIDTQAKKVELYTSQIEKAKNSESEYAKKIEELKNELSSAENALSEMKESTDTSTEALEKQEKAILELKEKLEVAEQGYEKSGRKISEFQTNLNNASVDLNNMQRELQDTEKYMEEAQSASDACATSIDAYGKTVRESGKEAERFGAKSEKAVGQLAEAIVATGLAKSVDAVRDALMGCVDASEQFGSATAKLSTIADTGSVSIGNLKEDILSVSTELAVSASDISDVAYDAISASVDTADAVNAASDAAKLAAAGFTDTSSALSVLTTTVNAYNMSASDMSAISDSLIQTQNLGVLTINNLASTMGKAISTASAYSVDLYNLEAGYIALTKSGISAEESTTYMSSMFSELGDAGSDVAGILREKTGKSFGELMKSGYSLGQVLGILSDSVNGNAESLMNLWGSQEAGKASNAIVNRGLEEFNENLNAVKDSSGSTQKAFDKMADTSEFASKKMGIAMQNLQIVIGSELEPAMDSLYSTGADIAEGAADFVENNPETVKAVAALAVGFGTFATAVTVAKVAMAAFNAVMNTNRVVLLVTAVAGLATAFGVLTDDQNEYVESTKEAVKESKENIDSLSEEIEKRRAAKDEMAATAATIDTLKSKLMDLNEKEKLSNAEKQEMAYIVEQLNTLLPDLNLAIDEQTGLLEQNNSELEKAIDNQRESLELQAVQEEQAEIVKEITEAKINLSRATAEQAELEAELAEKQEEYNKSLAEGTVDVYGALHQEILAATDAVAAYDEQIVQSQDTIAGLESEYEIVTGMVNQYKDAINEASDKTQGMNDVTVALGPAVYTVSQETAESMATLKAAYEESSAAAYDSISQQVSLFSELSTQSDLTVQQMAANLQSQTDTFNQYAEDLVTASELLKSDTTGSFSTILQSIMDMGTDGAGYLHELVTAAEDSTESFDEVMTSFAEMENAKQTLSNTMGAINTGYLDAVDRMIKGTNDGLDSMTMAFGEKTPEMRVASAAMCDEIYDQMKISVGMTDDGSSVVYQGTGNSIAKGIADGIRAGQPVINSAVQKAIDDSVSNADFSGISSRIDRMLGDQLK